MVYGAGNRDLANWHVRGPHDEGHRARVVDAGNVADSDVGKVDARSHGHRDRRA